MVNTFDVADNAVKALEAGQLRQSTPLARYALERSVRYDRFGQWPAPSEEDSKEIERVVEEIYAQLCL